MADRRVAPLVAVLLAWSLAAAGGAAGLDQGSAAPTVASTATTTALTATTPTPNTTAIPNESTTTNESVDANESHDTSGVILVDRNGTEILRAYAKLNCSTLRVNVTPDRWRYALRLEFVHEETGRRATHYAGPLNGTVTDPFGRTPWDLVAVDLRAFGRTVLSRTVPERCDSPAPPGE